MTGPKHGDEVVLEFRFFRATYPRENAHLVFLFYQPLSSLLLVILDGGGNRHGKDLATLARPSGSIVGIHDPSIWLRSGRSVLDFLFGRIGKIIVKHFTLASNGQRSAWFASLEVF